MIDTLVRLGLSPLLVAQAMQVRRIAQSLPEAAGPRSGVTGSGPDLRLAIIGDSSAAGVGVAVQSDALLGQVTALLAQDFTVHWSLDAVTGATSRSTLKRLEGAQVPPADVVITALGVNDVTRLIPAAAWVRQQERLFARLRALMQPRQIYVSGMPPLSAFPLLPEPLRWSLGRHAARLERARMAALARHGDITHVPLDLPLERQMMASDGFHPSAQTYALWAKKLTSRITSDWPEFIKNS